MLAVNINRVQTGKEERLRVWLSQLSDRRAEVVETFPSQGVRAMNMYLVPCGEDTLLVAVAEVDDLAVVRDQLRASTLPIDLEYKAIMADVLGAHVGDTPIFAATL